MKGKMGISHAPNAKLGIISTKVVLPFLEIRKRTVVLIMMPMTSSTIQKLRPKSKRSQSAC
jgi:hypothetical protein